MASLSLDKGFIRAEHWELLRLYIPEVVMPRQGKQKATKTERENSNETRGAAAAKHRWDCEMHRVEHHGLNRGLEAGLAGYSRYVGNG